MRKLYALLICVALTFALPLLTSCDKHRESDNIGQRGPENPDDPGKPDDPENPDDPADKAPHAMLFYFVGTNLDGFFGGNISAAMEVVDKNIPGRNRIAYFRRVSGSTWAINEIYYDSKSGAAATRELKRYENADLTRMDIYLSDMVALVPAKSYGIVFGGHGSAWIPKTAGSSWSKTYSVRPPQPYIMPFGEAPREDAVQTRYFGETSVMFDVEDIAADMAASGAKFDYVIFDDCFMSNIESLYAMRHAADYVIASPCEIMGPGFPYRTVLPCLVGPEYDFEGVCRAFYDFYMNYDYPSGCVALTDCSELEALAEAYTRLLEGATRKVELTELQYYEGLSKHLFYDFGQYAELLSADPARLDEFIRRFDRAFPPQCRLYTPRFYTAFGSSFDHYIDIVYYSGVTISEPADRNQTENRATEWYRTTHRR